MTQLDKLVFSVLCFALRVYRLMTILGIDPGTAATGYGVIGNKTNAGGRPNSFSCAAYGCIQTSKNLSAGKRLFVLEKELLRLFRKYRPDALAVETLFFFKNSKTAMTVSEARGVILLAAAKKNIAVYEFSPLQVKMTIAGYGRADKKQIQRMIPQLLGLSQIPEPDDAADALGLALTCSLALSNSLLMQQRKAQTK